MRRVGRGAQSPSGHTLGGASRNTVRATGYDDLEMPHEQGHRVLDALEAEGSAMPLVVLARRLDILPSRLVALLDDLYDEGLVTPGRQRGTVALTERPREPGRFRRDAAPAIRAPR